MKLANVYDALVMQLLSFMGGSKTGDSAARTDHETAENSLRRKTWNGNETALSDQDLPVRVLEQRRMVGKQLNAVLD